METKNDNAFCEHIKGQIRMEKALYMKPRGIAGGLALWWIDDTKVQVPTLLIQWCNSRTKMIRNISLGFIRKQMSKEGAETGRTLAGWEVAEGEDGFVKGI